MGPSPAELNSGITCVRCTTLVRKSQCRWIEIVRGSYSFIRTLGNIYLDFEPDSDCTNFASMQIEL